jgi:hypothetical protein
MLLISVLEWIYEKEIGRLNQIEFHLTLLLWEPNYHETRKGS